MPYTAKQRRYFHAQAEKGKPGMAKLAAEADAYAKTGKEKKPVAKPTMKSVVQKGAAAMPKTPARQATPKKAGGPATGAAVTAGAKRVAAAKKAAPAPKKRGSY